MSRICDQKTSDHASHSLYVFYTETAVSRAGQLQRTVDIYISSDNELSRQGPVPGSVHHKEHENGEQRRFLEM